MQAMIDWIVQYEQMAPWLIFFGAILAGLYIPISIDVLLIAAALLAAEVIPEMFWELYISVTAGCYCSALLCYWVGRIAGNHLIKFRWFQKLFPEKRREKIRLFYQKRGFLTVLIGRFIPFGVRNGIYTTAGMTKTSFTKFALSDLVACTTWSSLFFYLFHTLAKNYEHLAHFSKVINLSIFAAFALAVIAVIWYKGSRKKSAEN